MSDVPQRIIVDAVTYTETGSKTVADLSINRLPNLTAAERDASTVPAGTVIYNSDDGVINYYDGSTWQELSVE